MRISCPYCGERDAQEFVYRGDASPKRPEAEDGFYEYVYIRENVDGPMNEHWYHAQGCRTWIIVRRDTASHAVIASAFARDGAP